MSRSFEQFDRLKAFIADEHEQAIEISVQRLLERHDLNVDEHGLDPKNFWCLLQFRNGDCTVQCSIDHEKDSEDELVQLFTSVCYDFQIMFCSFDKEGIAPARDILAIDRVWSVPYHLWAAMFDNSGLSGASKNGPEEHNQLRIQTCTLSLEDYHLYIHAEGSMKTAILFGSNRSAQCFPSDLCDLAYTGVLTMDSYSIIRRGDYTTMIWIVDEACRRCSTEKDFVFLCVEVLLRPAIIKNSQSVRRDMKEFPNCDVGYPTYLSGMWMETRNKLLACREVIDNLPGWIDCATVENDRILQQYDLQLKADERAWDVYKYRIDFAFARTTERLAQDSMVEMKFSKILTVVAVIYLPVSIASSIFGMNLQELNGQGVSIGWFFLTIFVSLAGVIFCWLAFAIWTAAREEVKQNWIDLHANAEIYDNSRNWKYRIWFIDMTRARMREWPGRFRNALVRLINDYR